MRYIGPFFRMNSLSVDEISGQLFYLSKEAVKTIVLNSKCGLLASVRTSKKSSNNDISILNNFSPLLCIYRKASPMFIHNKTSHGFDESTFKKEIPVSANALMTLCILELSEYYSHFSKGKRNITSLEFPYKFLAKDQLQFYSENLRNAEGLFVTKKNTSEGNSKGYNLVDKDNKFKFSDQAFMMDAYLLYSKYNSTDEASLDYKNFSYEILNLFKDYKDSIYELSFSENVLIFSALNIFYKHSEAIAAKELLIDIGDYLINKFNEKDYYNDSIDDTSLFSMNLIDAYKHTDIISFKENAKEISNKLISLYDMEKNIFYKGTDKKEFKYSCSEINFYLLNLMKYSNLCDNPKELKPVISGLFRRFYVNGGLLTSWPEAPTLDEVERYKRLSLHSDDMLDETYFRMPVLATPKSSGLAPVFIKNLEYSRKKDSISKSRITFDSSRNMLNFFLIINTFKNQVEETMELDLEPSDNISPSNARKINNAAEEFHCKDDPETILEIEQKTSDKKTNIATVVENAPTPPISLTGLSESTNENIQNTSKKSKSKKNKASSSIKKS